MEWADARVWTSAFRAPPAITDPIIRDRLFHIHVVQWAFLHFWLDRPLPSPSQKSRGHKVGVFMRLNLACSHDCLLHFRNVAPGRYAISVSRDGFIPQEDRKRGLTVSGLSVTVAAGQTLKDITLPMVPAPALAGTVFDPHGEPLAAALVRAYQRVYTPYGTQLKIVKKGMTNDLGEFRLFGLNFGACVVSAGYGDRDRASAVGKTQLSANVSKADDGYATAFYDGTDDMSRAAAAQLAPGLDASSLNIYLRDSSRFKIRGQVLPLIAETKIIVAPKGSDLSEADYFIQPDASGAFEIRGLSTGSYVLLATAAAGTLSSDVMTINITDSDIVGVRLALQETMSVSGSLVLEGSPRANLSGYHVKLVRSSTEFEQKIDTRPAPDGTFTLERVVSLAEYDIVVEPLSPGTYVRSLKTGGLSILQGRSRLLPMQPLQIVLAMATNGLDVHVFTGPDAVAGAQVVLIPDVLMRRRGDRYITGFTNESGDVRLGGVPSGRYVAYAFEQIEPGANYELAYSPEAENRFRDHAVVLTVGEGGTKAIQLKVIPAAETAGGF